MIAEGSGIFLRALIRLGNCSAAQPGERAMIRHLLVIGLPAW
jgi:hypothetical protein